jgi:hypothetical protein
MRDCERQQHEGRREWYDEQEHRANDNRERRRALAFVCDLAKVRGFVLDRMYRMAYEPFVPWYCGSFLLLHVSHDRG